MLTVKAPTKHGKPCGKCGGTLRYVSSRFCVACQHAINKARSKSAAPPPVSLPPLYSTGSASPLPVAAKAIALPVEEKSPAVFVCPRCNLPGEKVSGRSLCTTCRRKNDAERSAAYKRRRRAGAPAERAAKHPAEAAPRSPAARVPQEAAPKQIAPPGESSLLRMRGASMVTGRLREIGGVPDPAGKGWLIPAHMIQVAICAVNNPHIFGDDVYSVTGEGLS